MRSRPEKRAALAVAGAAVVAMTSVGLLTAPSQGAAAPMCFGRVATIVGNSHSNEIHGTSGPDVIAGRGGSDHIEGRGGNDRICGHRGNDELAGGHGNDRLRGGRGHDEAKGGPGSDICFAEEKESC